MQAVKSTHTKLENIVIKELWRRGVRFRRNVANLKGKPDIAIKKYRVVIFIDSCFWHGCDLHCRLPESNVEYWSNKITGNKNRDLEITSYYLNNGWFILRIWEHQLKENLNNTLEEIIKFINLHKALFN